MDANIELLLFLQICVFVCLAFRIFVLIRNSYPYRSSIIVPKISVDLSFEQGVI